MCRQTLPEGDATISTAGQDPGVWRSLGFGAHTHVRIQAKAQQEAAQQGGVVLTVPLRRTHSDDFSSFQEFEVWGNHIINIMISVSSFFFLTLMKGQHTFIFNF